MSVLTVAAQTAAASLDLYFRKAIPKHVCKFLIPTLLEDFYAYLARHCRLARRG